MNETLAPPDMTRFTEHQSDLVAFMATAIVGLVAYILLKEFYNRREDKQDRKEQTDVMKQLAIALATLTEAVRNVKDK